MFLTVILTGKLLVNNYSISDIIEWRRHRSYKIVRVKVNSSYSPGNFRYRISEKKITNFQRQKKMGFPFPDSNSRFKITNLKETNQIDHLNVSILFLKVIIHRVKIPMGSHILRHYQEQQLVI